MRLNRESSYLNAAPKSVPIVVSSCCITFGSLSKDLEWRRDTARNSSQKQEFISIVCCMLDIGILGKKTVAEAFWFYTY